MDVQSEIRKSKEALRLNISSVFTNSAGSVNSEDTLQKAEESEDIEKAIDSPKEEVDENPFEKAVSNEDMTEQDVEKSDIFYALNSGEGIKFSKTGKEIKDQVNASVIPALNAELATKTNEANTLLADCGNAPTKDVDNWWTGDQKMDIPFKVYSWEQTCCDNGKATLSESLSVTDAQESKPNNVPASKAEADTRNKYNDVVRNICNITVDLRACEMLQNLKDKQTFELSARQLVAFGFSD